MFGGQVRLTSRNQVRRFLLAGTWLQAMDELLKMHSQIQQNSVTPPRLYHFEKHQYLQ